MLCAVLPQGSVCFLEKGELVEDAERDKRSRITDNPVHASSDLNSAAISAESQVTAGTRHWGQLNKKVTREILNV